MFLQIPKKFFLQVRHYPRYRGHIYIRRNILPEMYLTPHEEYVPPQMKEIMTHPMLQHPDFFEVHNLFTVKDLFDAKVHYGHTEGTLNEYMRPFLFGSRLGHLIFDLDKTASYLRKALNMIAHVSYRNGIILFVSRSPQHTLIVEDVAKEVGEYAHAREWRDGTFTNAMSEFKGVIRLPDLCIFLSALDSVLKQHPGVLDCARMMIPSIGVCDTNSDPRAITYPVPGNDDTTASIQFYLKVFKEAIMRGKKYRAKLMENATSTNNDSH